MLQVALATAHISELQVIGEVGLNSARLTGVFDLPKCLVCRLQYSVSQETVNRILQ